MKVVSLNEAIKHSLFKPNFDIEIFFIHFIFFNIHIIQSTQLSMIHMPLKWHHIDKCNKNCRKVDILTSILAQLNSFTPSIKKNWEWLQM
jgi:hypothetical protein